MELRQLRYFVRVVELGSMSRAALDLNLVQSALSQQISRLEGELSTRLLQRTSKGTVPTEAVTIYCLATALLSAIAHLTFEETQWPVGLAGWAAVVGLGLGPVGAAFFTWDMGMKKGDIQMLGVASYAAPLLSTLALVGAGIAAPSLILAAAAVLIAA